MNEALRHWLQLLSLISSLPESPEVLEFGTEALGYVIMSRARLGGSDEEVEALFAEGKERSRRLADPAAKGRLLVQYGMSRAAAGRLAQALPSLEEALELADTTGDRDAEAGALYSLSVALLNISGDCQTALAVIDRGLAITSRDAGLGAGVVGSPVASLLLVWKALALALIGRLQESERTFERLSSLVGKQEPVSAIVADWAHTLAGDLLGTPASAMSHARRTLEIQGDGVASETLPRFTYGFACFLCNQMTEAVASLELSLKASREHGSYRFAEPMTLIALARAQRGRGDIEAALAIATEAAELTTERGWLGADARIALSNALVDREAAGPEDFLRASQALDEAERLVAESGAASRQPFIHDARAALAERTGDSERNHRELAEADRLYAAMGTTRRSS
jgi:tetratricopeptide (TPR) repeat protein